MPCVLVHHSHPTQLCARTQYMIPSLTATPAVSPCLPSLYPHSARFKSTQEVVHPTSSLITSQNPNFIGDSIGSHSLDLGGRHHLARIKSPSLLWEPRRLGWRRLGSGTASFLEPHRNFLQSCITPVIGNSLHSRQGRALYSVTLTGPEGRKPMTADQTSHDLTAILLSPLPRCWDYRHAPWHVAFGSSFEHESSSQGHLRSWFY